MSRVSKRKLLDHLVNDVYVRVGRSTIQGAGLFAVRDIPLGTDPFMNLYDPPTYAFSDDELKDVPAPVRKMIYDFCGKENGRTYIPATGMNPVDLIHFLNHSGTPNVRTINGGSIFHTTRDIYTGEELFADYATYDEDFHTMHVKKP